MKMGKLGNVIATLISLAVLVFLLFVIPGIGLFVLALLVLYEEERRKKRRKERAR